MYIEVHFLKKEKSELPLNYWVSTNYLPNTKTRQFSPSSINTRCITLLTQYGVVLALYVVVGFSSICGNLVSTFFFIKMVGPSCHILSLSPPLSSPFPPSLSIGRGRHYTTAGRMS